MRGFLGPRLFVPAGGLCENNRPCWKATGHGATAGFKYKRNDGTPNGITAISLKAGSTARAKIAVKGKGLLLDVPGLPLAEAPSPARVQLLNSTPGNCWEASYSPPAQSGPTDTESFKDKND